MSNNTKHGESKTPTYSSYRAMVTRCTKEYSNKFKHYGGRGIQVCERWLCDQNGYTNFVEDMGHRPQGLTLDRADVNGDYEPDNCRWVDTSSQSYNTRIRKDNKSGKAGVRVMKSGKYEAHIRAQGKYEYLGMFDTFEDAVRIREQAEMHYYGFIKQQLDSTC